MWKGLATLLEGTYDHHGFLNHLLHPGMILQAAVISVSLTLLTQIRCLLKSLTAPNVPGNSQGDFGTSRLAFQGKLATKDVLLEVRIDGDRINGLYGYSYNLAIHGVFVGSITH